jgi:hypothetical protein
MTQTTRGARAEAHYRHDMRTALTAILLIMNPKDQINYPTKYEDLVEYTLDWLKTEQQEVAEIPALPSAKINSGPSLSLEE